MQNDARERRLQPVAWWRSLLGLVLAAAVVVGVVAGLAFVFMGKSGYFPWFSMKPLWEAPYERGDSDHGNGAFLVGDSVVRSRFDGVTAFDVRTGRKRWEFRIPGRADLCTISHTEGAIALISYGEAGPEKPGVAAGSSCGTLAALDVTTGRELWRTTRVPGSDAAVAGRITSGGGLGVILDGDDSPLTGARSSGSHAVRAFDLVTGAARWQAAVPEGCVTGKVAAGPRDVLAALSCAGEVKLAAFAIADGKVRWMVPLDARRGVAEASVSFLSADPPVVWVKDRKQGGVRAILTFGQDGRPQSRIDDAGPYGDLKWAAVAGEHVITAADYQGSQSTLKQLVAFDLATGRERWREDLGNVDGFEDLYAQGNRVTVVTTSSKYDDRYYVYDAATGDEEDDRGIRAYASGASVLHHKGLLITVRWGAGERPVSVYERW
ncbi:PQQ-binding-like beta-propeller repeat protein [Streptomyces yangpuensis]|uniref:outer membrane protein assembly factor BamB family protein n=1 Tax=Streptomyces yangpuensis TaxID=1648182 RepID=UPI00372144C6